MDVCWIIGNANIQTSDAYWTRRPRVQRRVPFLNTRLPSYPLPTTFLPYPLSRQLNHQAWMRGESSPQERASALSFLVLAAGRRQDAGRSSLASRGGQAARRSTDWARGEPPSSQVTGGARDQGRLW
jgi:hypothetical protein